MQFRGMAVQGEAGWGERSLGGGREGEPRRAALLARTAGAASPAGASAGRGTATMRKSAAGHVAAAARHPGAERVEDDKE